MHSNSNSESKRPLPTASSQPVLLSSNPLLRYAYERYAGHSSNDAIFREVGREPSRESEDSSNSLEPNRLLADFVGGLGPGQVAGRQALGAGILGELQISLQVCNYYVISLYNA